MHTIHTDSVNNFLSGGVASKIYWSENVALMH